MSFRIGVRLKTLVLVLRELAGLLRFITQPSLPMSCMSALCRTISMTSAGGRGESRGTSRTSRRAPSDQPCSDPSCRWRARALNRLLERGAQSLRRGARSRSRPPRASRRSREASAALVECVRLREARDRDEAEEARLHAERNRDQRHHRNFGLRSKKRAPLTPVLEEEARRRECSMNAWLEKVPKSRFVSRAAMVTVLVAAALGAPCPCVADGCTRR